MAWAPDYCTVAQLKTHLRVTDSADDTPMGISITAASRSIDHWCNRQFGSASQTRYYTYEPGVFVEGRDALAVDDLASSSGLTVSYDTVGDGTHSTATTVNTDWVLWPRNANSNGVPWTHLTVGLNPTQYFPYYAGGIRIVGTFGWSSVPSVVTQACLIQSARYFQRRDAAFGVAGSPEAGNELRLLKQLDPDVQVLLGVVRRPWGAVRSGAENYWHDEVGGARWPLT